MKWWMWLIVALLIAGVVIGVSVGTSEAAKRLMPSPVVPTVTIQPYPSLSITPYIQELVLFYDTFDGINGVPLTGHTPNAPSGALWLDNTVEPPIASLTLNGTGSAINSVDVEAPISNPLIFKGANVTAGTFVNGGYQPTTDTLELQLSVAIPTITPTPTLNEAAGFAARLTRLTPTNDYVTVEFQYSIGTGISGAPSWYFRVSTTRQLPSNTQIVYYSGVISGSPPIETDIDISLSIAPTGICTVVCPGLGVNASGPSEPDLVPQNGYAMQSLWLTALGTQNSDTYDQPLYVRFTSALVTATRLVE